MRFLADESIHKEIVDQLRAEEYIITCVSEIAQRIPDNAVIELANYESVIILTEDKDFGELVFRQNLSTQGVVLVRLQGLSPNEKAKRISEAIRDNLYRLQDRFTVISKDKVRMRSY